MQTRHISVDFQTAYKKSKVPYYIRTWLTGEADQNSVYGQRTKLPNYRSFRSKEMFFFLSGGNCMRTGVNKGALICPLALATSGLTVEPTGEQKAQDQHHEKVQISGG